MEGVKLKQLHDCSFDLKCKVASLLNSFWPRSPSEESHEESIERSNDNMPTHLVLIKEEDDENGEIELIGHSKISKCVEVPNDPHPENSIKISIEEKYRGKGYGKAIIQFTHQFIRSKGYGRVYLSTKYKESFYEHLGYTPCHPVKILINEEVNPLRKFFTVNLDDPSSL